MDDFSLILQSYKQLFAKENFARFLKNFIDFEPNHAQKIKNRKFGLKVAILTISGFWAKILEFRDPRNQIVQKSAKKGFRGFRGIFGFPKPEIPKKNRPNVL